MFDKDMQLICWNRQFRELLNLPPELGQVGVPLDKILRACAERGDFGDGDIDKLVADRLMKLALAHEMFQEQFDGGRRILEIRTSPMPQGGIVTTYSDITERVAASEALARANETLERRVRERTAELTDVNEALAVAKRKADQANLDKTRFLAAASHDVLQPLNAARLYATSLVERTVGGQEATLARNIDASLEAVEEILGVLIEISRLDTGRLEPEITVFPLQEVFERLEVEFQPLAREKGLELRMVATQSWVRSDRRLLRRILQNLLSNAIKYTTAGKVLFGVRRHGDRLAVLVCDTGPGIPASKHALIFKEFERLPQTASAVRGLGLGLSIVERIGKVLGHRVQLRSALDRGSTFAVELPPAEPRVSAEPVAAMTPSAGRIAGLTVLCIDNEPAGSARHPGAAGGVGMHRHHRQERGGSYRAAGRERRPGRHHPRRLPSRRRHRRGGGGGGATCRGVGGPCHRRHGGSLRGSAARGAPARLRPPAQADQSGGAARADVPAHLAAGGGGGVGPRPACHLSRENGGGENTQYCHPLCWRRCASMPRASRF